MDTAKLPPFHTLWPVQQVMVPLARWLNRYYFHTRHHNLEAVPQDKPLIYVTKHPRSWCYWETIILGTTLFAEHLNRPPFRVIEKEATSIHHLPIIGWLRQHTGAIGTSYAEAVQTLNNGESLLIFPGGGSELYAPPYRLAWRNIHHGFAKLAIENQVEVVPIAMCGADEQHLGRLAIGKRKSIWLPLAPLPVQFDFHYGTPLLPPTDNTAKNIKSFGDLVRSKLLDLLNFGLKKQQPKRWQTLYRQRHYQAQPISV